MECTYDTGKVWTRAEVFNRLAEQNYAMQEYNKAIEYYKKAMDNGGDYAETCNNIAISYMNMDRYDMAKRYLNSALLHEPDNTNLLLTACDWCAMTQNFGLATEYAVKIIRADVFENTDIEHMETNYRRAKLYYDKALNRKNNLIERDSGVGDDEFKEFKRVIDDYGEELQKRKEALGDREQIDLPQLKRESKNASPASSERSRKSNASAQNEHSGRSRSSEPTVEYEYSENSDYIKVKPQRCRTPDLLK